VAGKGGQARLPVGRADRGRGRPSVHPASRGWVDADAASRLGSPSRAGGYTFLHRYPQALVSGSIQLKGLFSFSLRKDSPFVL